MYYVMYGFLWLLSLLPLRILYFFSDCFYGLIYYILKYRRDVVMHNLNIAFPGMAEKGKREIAKKFYHNLVDTFVETIKLISASPAYIERRFQGNWDEINRHFASGRNVQVQLGHNFNWEWGNIMLGKKIACKVLMVYMPLVNKAMDRLFLKIRSKTGVTLLPATNMNKHFIPYRKTQYCIVLVADQNPGFAAGATWVNFFNRPTPFLKGPARTALSNNNIVAFANIHRLRRGHYETTFITIHEKDAKDISPEELTLQFVHYLENVIRQYPASWLWSHRRFKWEWKPEYGEVLN
jgi:Kdo2-lipid IVA lauroyltransferase/acyltransferase